MQKNKKEISNKLRPSENQINQNNRKDPPIGLYITLIVVASVFGLGLIIFIIIYIMRKRRRRLEEEDITSDGPKELNLKTTVKEDD